MSKVNHKQAYRALSIKTESYVHLIKFILDKAIEEVAASAILEGYTGDDWFDFSEYPITRRLFEEIQVQSAQEIQAVIINGSTALWKETNLKNDKIVYDVLGKRADLAYYKRYFSNNEDALNSFITRKTKGLNLSDRIWKLQAEFKTNMEASLSVGMESGMSAAKLSREIREYLNEPKKLFRRLKEYDDDGNFKRWKLSKNALEYNPGAGQYRSSYKNAMRLTRSEINMAYRTADQVRWAQLDFVVGYEVKRSMSNNFDCPLCDALVGRYPKDFTFKGWHPQCMCYIIPILKTEAELDRDAYLMLQGLEPSDESVNRINDVPDGYKKWVQSNTGSIERSKERGTIPFFLKDNPEYSNINHVMLERARAYSPIFGGVCDDIADKTNSIVTPVNVKSSDRIIEKAINDYNGDASAVKDVLRNTFIASENDHDKIIREIEHNFDVSRIKRQISSNDRLGYSGVVVNVIVDGGLSVEMQINSAAMIYGKEVNAKNILGAELFNKIKSLSGVEHGLGHKWYEEYRTLSASDKRRKELEKLSRKYYDKLRGLNF